MNNIVSLVKLIKTIIGSEELSLPILEDVAYRVALGDIVPVDKVHIILLRKLLVRVEYQDKVAMAEFGDLPMVIRNILFNRKAMNMFAYNDSISYVNLDTEMVESFIKIVAVLNELKLEY